MKTKKLFYGLGILILFLAGLDLFVWNNSRTQIQKPEVLPSEISEKPQLPYFEDYPVKEIFQGLPVPVDFDSVPNVTVISPGVAVDFKTKLIEDAKKGPILPVIIR